MPSNIKSQNGWTKFSSEENDKGILLPISLYREFARASSLEEGLRQVQIITAQNLSLWAYGCGKTVSAKTIAVFLQDMVNDGLLLEVEDEAHGTYYVRTKQWENLNDANKIAKIQLNANAAIQEIKRAAKR